jgi:hypothetical protein
MAKIHEEVLVVKLSKLVKESDPTNNNIVSEEVLFSLEQFAQELVGESVVVEVVRT